MIKYKLKCKDCLKCFDSWFSSSKEFDKLKKLRLVDCKYCNSLNIAKSLMSPNIIKKQNINSDIIENSKKLKAFKNKVKKYQKFIKKNLDYVGEDFAYEARSIHYSSKETSKGIYGKATKDEINELNEEGIDIQTIPWLNENEN